MKLPLALQLPADINSLVVKLNDLLVMSNKQVNMLTEGSVSAKHSARSSVPTTGTWKSGDFVPKDSFAEAGGAGSKYVIIGWNRITSGSNNVLNTDWVECRCLTGN